MLHDRRNHVRASCERRYRIQATLIHLAVSIGIDMRSENRDYMVACPDGNSYVRRLTCALFIAF